MVINVKRINCVVMRYNLLFARGNQNAREKQLFRRKRDREKTYQRERFIVRRYSPVLHLPSAHSVACYLFRHFTVFQSGRAVLRAWLNFMQFQWYRFYAAAQIYLKFGTEPALSAAKPHCGRTAQAAGMTTFRRRHVLRSESINKE